jgi:hypothetical protein
VADLLAVRQVVGAAGRSGPAGRPESLLLRCLTARDLTGLAEKLCLQERLDQLDPQELATLYQDKTVSHADK